MQISQLIGTKNILEGKTLIQLVPSMTLATVSLINDTSNSSVLCFSGQVGNGIFYFIFE